VSALFWLQLLVYARQVCSGDSRGGAWDPKVQRYGSDDVCVSITAVPIIKLFAWGEGDTRGHVLRGTTSRGLCGLVCPSRTNERWGEGDCVKGERWRRFAKGTGWHGIDQSANVYATCQ
jgi:hypothetical protein